MIEKIENKLKYKFKNRKLLEHALIHSSYAHENNFNLSDNNERLEFLGDAVVELTISKYLYDNFENMPEGEMTKFRAGVVCEASLSNYARKLGMGKWLMLGKGEEMTGGRDRDSILCDLFEAVIGAIYLDSNFDTVQKFIIDTFGSEIANQKNDYISFDYKTNLQEVIQKNSKNPLSYKVKSEQGPDHQKVFVSIVIHENNILGEGKGKSKKESEQNAALNALNKLEK